MFLNTGYSEIDIFVHYKQISFNETSKDLDDYTKGQSVQVKIIDIKDEKVNGSISAWQKDPLNFLAEKKGKDIMSIREE